MKLVIVSGRSGSGKSVALRVLEDLGYYCVDNLPLPLIGSLLEQGHHRLLVETQPGTAHRVVHDDFHPLRGVDDAESKVQSFVEAPGN